MRPTDNGQGLRRRLLPVFRFRAALARPFGKFCAAAFTPASGSLIHPSLLTFLALRFWFLQFVIILRRVFCFVNIFLKKIFTILSRRRHPFPVIFPVSLDNHGKYGTLKPGF